MKKEGRDALYILVAQNTNYKNKHMQQSDAVRRVWVRGDTGHGAGVVNTVAVRQWRGSAKSGIYKVETEGLPVDSERGYKGHRTLSKISVKDTERYSDTQILNTAKTA